MHSQRVILRAGVFGLFGLMGTAGFACTADSSYAPASDPSVFDAGRNPGQSTDAGSDATVTDAEVPIRDSGTDAADSGPEEPPGICAELSIGAGELLPFSTADDDRGLSVTPNGLAAAWITGSDGDVTVHYVDRADTSSAFGPARTTTGAFAADRVALTPDGLGLAVVNADRLGFSLLSRASATEAFGGPGVGPFSNLNVQGATVFEPSGLTYADPLFAHGGLYFVFSRVGGPATDPTVILGSRFSGSDPFSPGGAYAETGLLPDGTNRKIVTSMSSDERTLFVWDQALQKSRAMTLSPNPYTHVTSAVDLGTMRDVQVSTDCKTVYYVQSGELYRYAVP